MTKATRVSKAAREEGIKCPSCGSRELWSVGFTPTKEGRKSRAKCTVCATSFYIDNPVAQVKVRKAKRVVRVVKEKGTRPLISPTLESIVAPPAKKLRKVNKPRAPGNTCEIFTE